MTTRSGYTLYRVTDIGELVLLSTHPTLGEAFSAGQSAVHRDKVHAYAAYHGDRSVARFAISRIMRAAEASPGLETLVIF